MNLIGSGNETSSNILENDQMTLSFTSFSKDANTVQVRGSASIIHPYDPSWVDCISLFSREHGARQIFVLSIDKVISSCGWSTPISEGFKTRTTLTDWYDQSSDEALLTYIKKKNLIGLNGKDTKVLSK